jgi:hypothetical protein
MIVSELMLLSLGIKTGFLFLEEVRCGLTFLKKDSQIRI